MDRFHSARARLAILASALLVLGGCFEEPGRSRRGPVAPGVSAPLLTESEAATLSSAGVGVVHHIVTARTQIEGHRVEEARNELVQARVLLENLLKGSPAVRAQSWIWHDRERPRNEEAQALAGELASIYDDPDRVEAAVAPAAVWMHLAAAVRCLERGERSSAIDHLGAAEDVVQLMVAAVAAREVAPAIN